MKAVLVGTDLMYRADGKLVPIEINTNVGVDETNRVETWAEVFDLEQGLVPYIREKNIKKVVADGVFATIVIPELKKLLPDLEYEVIPAAAMLVIEDEEGTLFVRTTYSDEAAVDGFCRDKIAFMTAIKDTDFATPCIHKTFEGLEEIGYLEPVDNDGMPTIVNKCKYPHYNHSDYPKCLNLTSREQVEAYANSDELESDHYLTLFNFSKEHLYSGNRLTLIRNWSIFVGEEEGIKSISVGNYTKVSGEIDFEKVKTSWNEDGTTSLEGNGRMEFIIGHWGLDSRSDLLLERGDMVWLADGSWKSIEDLYSQQDAIKALKVPVGEGVDIKKHTGDYNVTLDEWKEGSEYVDVSTYQVNRRIGFRSMISMKFADGSDWRDTGASSYPTIDPEDGSIVFKYIRDIVVGDKVVMIKYQEGEDKPIYEEREVVEITESSREIVEGYGMFVGAPYIFMTRISSDAGAYISIEHNAMCPANSLSGGLGCYLGGSCPSGCTQSNMSCDKGQVCCNCPDGDIRQ